MSASLTVFIPQLIPPLALWRRDFGFVPESPIFSSLLINYQVNNTGACGFARSLFSATGFSANKELPLAKYRVLSDSLMGSISGKELHRSQNTLLCADPVHCEAGMKDITLTHRVNDLSDTETKELLQLLNQHFAEDGLRFFAARKSDKPASWYCQLPAKESFNSAVLDEVVGENIFSFLPKSKHRNWLSLQNEVQMLLHSAPLNQTREIAGQNSVNSLWFWGGGEVFKAAQPFDHIYARSSCSEAQMLAEVTGREITGLPEHAEKLLDIITSNALSGNSQYNAAMLLDQLIQPAQMNDLDSWQHDLNKLEEDFIKPLWILQQQGKLGLSIDTCSGKKITPLQKPRWKFWKKSSVNLLDLA